jgi:cytochrome c oxidase assembly factor CtaG
VPQPAARISGVRQRRRGMSSLVAAVGFVGVAVGVLVVALRAAHGVELPRAGLPDPGPLTRWGLPVVRLLSDVLVTITVGLAVTAGFLLPGNRPDDPEHNGDLVGPAAYRLLRLAALGAASGAVAVAAQALLTLSDLLGRPVGWGIISAALGTFVGSVAQGQALLLQAILLIAVAVCAGTALTRGAAAAIAMLAVISALPPAFTGHAAGAGNHQLAVTSLVIHVAAAVLWAGGLMALVVTHARSLFAAESRRFAEVAGRFSRLALGCFVAVTITGVINAAVRLDSPAQLTRSGYGVLVIAKTVALLGLGGFGVAHRTRSLGLMRAGRRRAFARLAVGESILFAATFGLAVALSRSPAPAGAGRASLDSTTSLVGFPMPPAPTVARLVTEVLPDLFFMTVIGLGAAGYLAGVLRLRRKGVPWPLGRTISWLLGLAVIGVVTLLGVGKYAYLLFSVHMAQHLALSMVVPVFLVLGAPVTLALRALRPAPDPAVRGPREWLLIAVHSRALSVLGHPVTALLLVVGSLYGLYFSGLFTALMRSHLGHVVMLTHFMASGYLFFWMLIGVDPGRRRLQHPVLILVHLASMSFHAFFGIALMQAHSIVAADWFGALHPPWRTSLAADQSVAAGIAWSFGEIPAAAVFVVLVLQWIKADEREQRRFDRAADRAAAAQAAGEAVEDELTRYNAFLAKIATDARKLPTDARKLPTDAKRLPTAADNPGDR